MAPIIVKSAVWSCSLGVCLHWCGRASVYINSIPTSSMKNPSTISWLHLHTKLCFDLFFSLQILWSTFPYLYYVECFPLCIVALIEATFCFHACAFNSCFNFKPFLLHVPWWTSSTLRWSPVPIDIPIIVERDASSVATSSQETNKITVPAEESKNMKRKEKERKY